VTAHHEIKPSIPFVTVSSVLKGKHINFSSRDELTLFIHLFNLGVGNNIDLDLVVSDTLDIQVNLEGDLALTLPVTAEVLEFPCIGSSGLLPRDSLKACFVTIAYPELGTQERPEVISFKSDLQHVVHNLDTDFTSFHGLLVTAGNNSVTLFLDGGVDVEFNVSGTVSSGFFWRLLSTLTFNLEVEPAKPGTSIIQAVFVGKGFVDSASYGLPFFVGLLHFSIGNHGEINDGFASTRGQVQLGGE
jgi:hypothetical protein